MFTLGQIKEELLNRYNENVDLDYLENHIHIWNIENSTNDESDKVVFDEKSLTKIYQGIKLHKKGFNDNVIPILINEPSQNTPPEEYVRQKVESAIEQLKNNENNINKSITTTNSTNNLLNLTDKLSKKVSNEIISFLKNDNFLDNLFSFAGLKRDNEILAKQVEELLTVNESLEQKVFLLELEKASYKKIWGNFYIYIK